MYIFDISLFYKKKKTANMSLQNNIYTKKKGIALLSLVAVFFFNASLPVTNNGNESSEDLIQTIAFGSCNKTDEPQPLWKSILSHEPDLWIWLGDNIYADTNDPKVLAEKYAKQLKQPDYQTLVQSTKIVGTWDDHDFGKNDGDKHFEGKDITKAAMLRFLDVPETDDAWKRQGVYYSRTFGPEGKKVKVILLDGRYFRDKTIKNGRQYEPNLEGTILGEEQWNWLEEELHNSDAQIHIIANGTQIIPTEQRFEKWANFPNERKRLFRTIVDSKINNVLLLSGDRHAAEISKLEMGSKGTLHEVTASGLTHATSSSENETNRYRIGEKRICELNFGLIELNWNDPCTIKLELRGKGDKLFQTYDIAME